MTITDNSPTDTLIQSPPRRHGLILTPLMRRLTIQKKDLRVESWRTNEPFAWAQNILLKEIERQYNLGLPVRIVVLKGRQLGISTATEGVLFNWCFLHPGSHSLVIAHETKASSHLFGMTKLMWETWPLRRLFTEKHSSQKLLAWEETRSSMSVATARNAGSGRSFTYHAVHCSECAFWDTPERLMVGLNQSVPYKHGTIIVIESTANGIGNWYHDEWLRAVNRESSFVPLFFPWYKHMEYDFPNTTLKHSDLDAREREILSEFQSDGMTLGKLAWRRHAIKTLCLNDENQFKQEYPLTPQEAFLSTGTNIFPLNKLEACFKPKPGVRGMLTNNNGKLEFIRTATGPLTIFKYPGKKSSIRAKYVVAGDPSKTTYGDGACIQVINRYTLEQVAVWHGHIDPIPFAHKLIELGYYYNTALLNCEMEGPGYGSIAVLIQQGYPSIWRHRWADKAPGKVSMSYGWSTNYQRKHWAVDQGIWLIGQQSVVIHDEITYNQMANYVILNGGEMGPASEKGYDDAVMAWLIAIASHVTEPPLRYEKPPDPPTHDLFDSPPWEATPLNAPPIPSLRELAS